MSLILQSTQKKTKKKQIWFYTIKQLSNITKPSQSSVFYHKPHFTEIPPSHSVEMFDLSTKAQTVTRVDKEKLRSDLQVYI